MSSWTVRPSDTTTDGSTPRPGEDRDPWSVPVGEPGRELPGRPAPGPAAFRTAIGTLGWRSRLGARPTVRPAT